MKCDKCNSDRVMCISGKCSDMFYAHYKENEYNGYVPKGLAIGDKYGDKYGNYIEFSFCLECGKIQGEFPISEEKVSDALTME